MKSFSSVRAIVFAIDGVLTRRNDGIYETWDAINQRLGNWSPEADQAFLNDILGRVDHSIELAVLNSNIRGRTQEEFEKVIFDYQLAPGAKEIVKELHRRGIETAIISGNTLALAKRVAEQLGIHFAFASNRIHYDSGKRIQEILSPFADPPGRVAHARQLAAWLGISPEEEIAAVGGRWSVVEIFQSLGKGIALTNSPAPVLEAAAARIKTLPEILNFLPARVGAKEGANSSAAIPVTKKK